MSVNVNDNGILRKIAGGTLYADLPIGAEIMYEGTTVPNGYLACNGSTFSQSEYPDLYAVLGSTTLPNRSGYIIRAKYNVLPLDFQENLTNENLLDNAWFTINQRGQATYAASGYTVDRWRGWNAALELTPTANGITLENTDSSNPYYLTQYIEFSRLAYFRGKVMTVSLMLADGTIISGSGVVPPNDALIMSASYDDDNLVIRSAVQSGVNWYVDIKVGPEKSYNIRAMKLELGSISTLAKDTAPNYASELLKCQRFFYNIVAGASTVVSTGYALDTTRCRIAFNLPTRMRVTQPTITYNNSITVVGHGATHAVSAIDSVQVSNGNIQPLTLTTTGLVQYNTYIAVIDSYNSISISADL